MDLQKKLTRPRARPKEHPELLTQEQIDIIQGMAGLGLTVKEIASALNMSKSTFERYYAKQPELVDALSKGRANAHAKVAKTAYDMAVSGEHPNMTMFWLKCRGAGQWKDRQYHSVDFDEQNEIAGAQTQALLDISRMSDQEILDRMRILEMELKGNSYAVADE